MAKWNQAVILLLCCGLWCCCGTAAGCSPQGPANCTFETNVNLTSGTSDFTWCSWTSDGIWGQSSFTAYPLGRFAGLVSTSVTGRLTSRISCSTQGQEFCLDFRHRLDVADEIDLNVFIRNSVTQSEDKVWSASTGFIGAFQQAYIPISTQYDYTVVFEATRRSTPSLSNTKTVYLDDLKFVQRPCPTCFTEGPENCTFEIDYSSDISVFNLCSWTGSGGWISYSGSPSFKLYPGLHWNESYGQLTSRPACSTNGQTHCLMFDYKFSRSDTVSLTVSIHNNENGNSNTILWSATQVPIDDSWESAFVSIGTMYDFVVIFEATRMSRSTLNQNAAAFIDNVAYVGTPCNSIMPTTETPKSTPTTLNESPQTTISTSPVTTAQTNLPLIIGLAVIGTVVVILAVVVVVILLLFLRRRRQKDTGSPQHVFSNAAANVENSPEVGAYDDVFEIQRPGIRPPIIPSSRSVRAAGNAAASAEISTVAGSYYDDVVEIPRPGIPPPIVPSSRSVRAAANAAASAKLSTVAGSNYDDVVEIPGNRSDIQTGRFPSRSAAKLRAGQGAVGGDSVGDYGYNAALFPSEMYMGLSHAEQHGYCKIEAPRREDRRCAHQ